jgi:hypothetical protein
MQELECGTLFLTDVATVGGVKTGSDGAFLLVKDKLYNLSQYINLED